MKEGPRKLDLTMKVTDRIVNLSAVVSDYARDGAETTVRRFNQWVRKTREFLDGNFQGNEVAGFDRLPKPTQKTGSPEEINRCSKEYADYLRDLVTEIDEA